MSINHIKKQAKRLSRLLPVHLVDHIKPFALSACQELAAQANGYPSFHAASSKPDAVANDSEAEAIFESPVLVESRRGISSINHEGCLAEVGGVVASMSRATLSALTLAHADILERIGASKDRLIVPGVHPANDWTAIGFDVDRNVYSLNLRGICWEVSTEVLDSFIRNHAHPFLATEPASEVGAKTHAAFS